MIGTTLNESDLTVLQKYQQAYSNYCGDGVIDMDKRLRHKFTFQIYRLEDFVPKFNGVLPPSCQTPYWFTLVKKGSGINSIGHFTFPIQDHTLFVVPKRMIHSSRYLSTECSGYVMCFDVDLFLNNSFSKQCVVNRKIFRNPSRPYLNLDESQMGNVTTLFESILREHQASQHEKKEMLVVKVLELLIYCDQVFIETGADDVGAGYHPVIEKFNELVENKFYLQRSVQYYANILCIHPNHLNFLLKKHIGLNAKESIDNRIILESKYLLSNSDFIIKEIAHRLGFDDPNNFSTFFQKHTGCSPGSYRHSCQHFNAADNLNSFGSTDPNYLIA
jgi:AraC family transcriptional activator of pobA